ncbi:MAG: hypothetical protein Q9222_000318, partial [Ikaeria aurantiellina]
MSPSVKGSQASAHVALISLKNCLVNLPQSLVSILLDSNAPAQDVVVEVLVSDAAAPSKNGKHGQRSFYVGWSGMPSSRKSTKTASGRNERRLGAIESGSASIEIDVTFGRMLGLSEGQTVGLLLHLDPPLAHTVNIEPLTPGDWEIIELHATFLELNLLSQIRALPNPSYSAPVAVQVQQSHPLTIHLSPTSTANVIVSSLTPPLSSSAPFARIAPDAEVIIAPKTRPRMGPQSGSRSITSTGRRSAGARSARSGTSRHGHEGVGHKSPLLLRPCDRRLCKDLFDDEDDDQKNTGLRIWADPEIINKSGWGAINHVVVSVVRPPGNEPTTDPQRQQIQKELESSEAGWPTARVVATLLPWSEAADSLHAALSSHLCSSLNATGIVGGMIKVEVAQAPLSTTTNLLFFPFFPDPENKHDYIKFGGSSDTGRHQTWTEFKQGFTDSPFNISLLAGPVTDGLLVSNAVGSELRSYEGILRLRHAHNTKSSPDAKALVWADGSGKLGDVEIGNPVPNPFQGSTSSDSLDINGLLNQRPQMVGVDRFSDRCLSDLSHASSILLTGGLGSGKTSLAQSLGHRLRSQLQCFVAYLPCRKFTADELNISAIKHSIEKSFAGASWAVRLGGQSVVIMDDLDKVCSAETELQTQDNGRSRQISELISNIVRQHCGKRSNVTLLATCQSKESLNSILIGANLFKEISALKVPDKDRRRQILRSLFGEGGEPQSAMNGTSDHTEGHQTTDEAAWMDGSSASITDESSHSLTTIDRNMDFLDIAGRTDGYMPADLALLVSRAKSEALIRLVADDGAEHRGANTVINKLDFDKALEGFTPATLRNVPLQSSKTTFDSIGGLKETRKTLLETLQYPTLYAPIFAQCPLRLRSGILLYGYPGCGKTMLASAIAGECGLNFISVKGPEILNKYIGASEKSVRDLFERAESARPCVLFFDEFDSIAPKRGHDSTGVTDRVVNQLLTQMDGAEGLSGVYVLAATSRPDLIDPALLRPGRLDKSILCDLPDLEDRLDILRAISGKLRMNPVILSSSQRQSLHEIAQRTEGYSGADLQAVVYNAHLEAIHDELGDQKSPSLARKHSQKNTVDRQSLQKPSILQFRFGVEADREAKSTSVTRAKEMIEYNATVAKLEDLRQVKRKERQKRHESRGGPIENGPQVDKTGGEGTQQIMIQWKHLEASLASTRSSINAHERERLKRFYREFVVGRNGELPNGEGSTEVGGRSSL